MYLLLENHPPAKWAVCQDVAEAEHRKLLSVTSIHGLLPSVSVPSSWPWVTCKSKDSALSSPRRSSETPHSCWRCTDPPVNLSMHFAPTVNKIHRCLNSKGAICSFQQRVTASGEVLTLIPAANWARCRWVDTAHKPHIQTSKPSSETKHCRTEAQTRSHIVLKGLSQVREERQVEEKQRAFFMKPLKPHIGWKVGCFLVALGVRFCHLKAKYGWQESVYVCHKIFSEESSGGIAGSLCFFLSHQCDCRGCYFED